MHLVRVQEKYIHNELAAHKTNAVAHNSFSHKFKSIVKMLRPIHIFFYIIRSGEGIYKCIYANKHVYTGCVHLIFVIARCMKKGSFINKL